MTENRETMKVSLSGPITSAEQEQELLSNIMHFPERYMDLCEEAGVNVDWFGETANTHIWGAIERLRKSGLAIDLPGVLESLHGNIRSELLTGGREALERIYNAKLLNLDSKSLMRNLREHYIRRKVYEVFDETMYQCNHMGDVQSLLDKAESDILSIRSTVGKNQTPPFSQAVDSAIENIRHAIASKGQPDGLCTGYDALDQLTCGLHPGELLVIAARPSMGKTALMLNIVNNILQDDEACVLLFSFEMSATALAERMYGSYTGVTKHLLSRTKGVIGTEQLAIMTAGAEWLKSRKLIINDSCPGNIFAIKSYARRIRKDNPNLKCIAVDYLQMLRSNSHQAMSNREREVSEISGGLKSLATELGVPVIVLSQLNRAVDSRCGKNRGIPMLSDLRDSGSIEQDADLVALLHRPYYYMDKEDPGSASYEFTAFLDLAKNRNGATGRIPLYFDAPKMQFSAGSICKPGVKTPGMHGSAAVATPTDCPAERQDDSSEGVKNAPQGE